jgi:thioredoxin reductase
VEGETMAETDVAIIGAGPYGLSIAAHLAGRGVEHRVIGRPMSIWREKMPKGMELKSDGFASSLYDPKAEFQLRTYCAEIGEGYADLGLPTKRETFYQYGITFQRRYVPGCEAKNLAALEKTPKGFILRLDDDSTFSARRVVVATGITNLQYTPPDWLRLPSDVLTHSSDHTEFSRFSGRHVTVFGRGASAIDTATFLHEAGANVLLVSRSDLILHSKMRLPRPLYDRIRHPNSGIGPGLKNRILTDLPFLFHFAPERLRLKFVRRYLGPSGGYSMRERIMPVHKLVGYEMSDAKVSGRRVQIKLQQHGGAEREVFTDHIIAATGFRTDLRRLPFLDSRMLAAIKMVDHTPILSLSMESSVPGLYFVGPLAANSFGPVLRFAYGAKFTAPWISQALGWSRSRVEQRLERDALTQSSPA